MARAKKAPEALPYTNAFLLAIATIVESVTNPRRRWGDLDALASSITEHGVIEPCIVRPLPKGRYELVVGSRRYRAAKMANLDAVPCIVRELTDEEVEEIQLVENNQREDVGPIEEGDAFVRQLDRGKAAVDIAKRLGRTPKYVEQRVRIARASEPVRSLVERGFLGLGGALLLAASPPEDQERIAERLDRGDGDRRITANEVLQELGLWSRLISRAPFDPSDASLIQGAGPCSHCPKNSATQLSLIDVVEDNGKCLDGKCWDAKSAARNAAAIADAEARGFRVVKTEYGHGFTKADEYAYQVFDDDPLRPKEPEYDADETDDAIAEAEEKIEAWEQSSARAWSTLTNERILVVPEHGDPFLAVPKEAVERVLSERGKSAVLDAPKTNDAAHREAQKIATRKLDLAMGEILSFVSEQGAAALWPALARAAIDRAGFDACMKVVARRGLATTKREYQGNDYVGAVRAIVDDLSIIELQGLVIELLLWQSATQTWNADTTPWAEALDVARVDLDVCEHTARAELEAKAVAKPKRPKGVAAA